MHRLLRFCSIYIFSLGANQTNSACSIIVAGYCSTIKSIHHPPDRHKFRTIFVYLFASSDLNRRFIICDRMFPPLHMQHFHKNSFHSVRVLYILFRGCFFCIILCREFPPSLTKTPKFTNLISSSGASFTHSYCLFYVTIKGPSSSLYSNLLSLVAVLGLVVHVHMHNRTASLKFCCHSIHKILLQMTVSSVCL